MARASRPIDTSSSNPWAGTAFLVEALVLLLLLLATLAVFVGLLAPAITKGVGQERLDRAVCIASNTAETFSSDPEGFACEPEQDGLHVSCDVVPERMGAGTLYEATITVSDDEAPIYQLSCARYVGGDAA